MGSTRPVAVSGSNQNNPRAATLVATVEYEKVEVGAVQRSLTKPRLDVGSASLDHVMRTLHRVEATGQPIVLVQQADLSSSVCSQPRLDHGHAYRRDIRPVFLDREAVADQHLTHNVIGTVDFEVDSSKPGLTGVSKPALDDMCNPVGSCVGHDDRGESYPVAPVDCDHCGFWATEVIEPEELREIVG